MRTLFALLLSAICLAVIVACDNTTPDGRSTPTNPSMAESQAVRTAPATPGRSTAPVEASGCLEYLGLLVSADDQAAEAALTSYRCPSLYVDSTGRYPPYESSLTITPGAELTLLFGANGDQQPSTVEMRLYSGAGVSGAFQRWPEDFSVGILPVDSTGFLASSPTQYVPHAAPGMYSLVIRAAWEESVDIFYALGIKIEASQPAKPAP